jgi:hypothetical protein
MMAMAKAAMRAASADPARWNRAAACRDRGLARMSLAAKGFFVAARTGTARRFG